MEYIDDNLEEEESSTMNNDIDFIDNFTATLKEKWIDSCDEDLSIMHQCLILQKGGDLTDIYNSTVNENLETSSETLSNKSLYTFLWKEGGNEVKLTGSFSDWKNQFLMKKDPKDNYFKITLPLNNEIYQYKFIIDGQWKCSSNEPTTLDGCGNRNNILDLTNPNNQNLIKSQIKDENKNKNNKKNLCVFGNSYPTSEEMKGISPDSVNSQSQKQSKPFSLGLKTKQSKIGEKKYVKKFDKEPNTLEKNFKPLFRECHMNIDHLIFEAQDKNKKNKVNKKNKNKNFTNKINKTGITFRYREKACTFIYYKSH